MAMPNCMARVCIHPYYTVLNILLAVVLYALLVFGFIHNILTIYTGNDSTLHKVSFNTIIFPTIIYLN